jgi:hypothetical protein
MAKKPPKTRLRRRDATGHLDPRYAAELLEQSRENQTSDPPPGGFVADGKDDLAEELGENFVQAATSAEDGDEDAGDELIRDEPLVPDGDDDDIDFEPEELLFPSRKPRSSSAQRSPTRKAPRATAKAGRSRPVKAKAAAAAAKATKKAGKSKLGRASSKSKTSKTKAKAITAKPAPKKTKTKTKKKLARKTTKRAR